MHIIATVLLVCISILAQPSVLSACECPGLEILWENFNRSAAVFEGRVESMQILGTPLNSALYQFRIERSYKGPHSGSTWVRSSSDSCGMRFEIGSRYLVFAISDPLGPYFFTDECLGPSPISQAHTQIGFLRGGKRSEEEWRKLLEKVSSPPQEDATIHGRIRGCGEKVCILESWLLEDGQRTYSSGAQVQADGTFSLPLHRGQYLLFAHDTSFPNPAIGYYHDADRAENARPVSIDSGRSVLGIDFEIRTPRIYTVKGRIDCSSDHRIRIVDVWLRHDMPLVNLNRKALIHPDGLFEFQDVYPGQYSVETSFEVKGSDHFREWKASVPLVRIPDQTEGIVVSISSTSIWFPLYIRYLWSQLTARQSSISILFGTILFLSALIALCLRYTRRRSLS
jgi:hypothetical protein